MSTAPRFDEIVHAPNRLQICAILSAVGSADFATVREGLGVADSVLSKHIRVLHEAGDIEVHKSTCASRARTSMSMTAAGRAHMTGTSRPCRQSSATRASTPMPAEATGSPSRPDRKERRTHTTVYLCPCAGARCQRAFVSSPPRTPLFVIRARAAVGLNRPGRGLPPGVPNPRTSIPGTKSRVLGRSHPDDDEQCAGNE